MPDDRQPKPRCYVAFRCSECNEQQFITPSGLTCENGHGGAPSVDMTTGAVTECPDLVGERVSEPEPGELGDFKIHIEVTLEPEYSDGEKRSDRDPEGISIDLDDLRIRRDAGHDAAVEVAGRLLPRLVESVRRVLW